MTSLTRRHFTLVVAAAGAQVAAAGTLLSGASPARARGRKGGRGRGRGRGGGSGGPRCFLRGTHILTADGEMRIENLEAGNLLITHRGDLVPVKWISHRTYQKHGDAWPIDVRPVKVCRGAISSNTPHRDLYLSPWHFLLFDGFLMPVKDLVNDISISFADIEGENIEYFHVALENHEVIYAEGVFAETLLVQGDENRWGADSTDFEIAADKLHSTMTAAAPRLWFSGGRSQLIALFRVAASNLIDIEDPIQKVYLRLATRSQSLTMAHELLQKELELG